MARSSDAPETGHAWTDHEVQLIVADYLAMLRDELLGRRVNKAVHNRALQQLLPARSRSSIEFKHGNISAVLIAEGLPYIRGYQPRRNAQHLLHEVTQQHLDEQDDLVALIDDVSLRVPDQLPALPQAMDAVFTAAPEQILLPERTSEPWLSRRGRKYDFVEREARQRALGEMGERFVLDVERKRLEAAGREDLARQVTWASRDWGDGLGYDVRSFDAADEGERLIEVKTSNQGRHFPFYLTDTELRCSQGASERFQLYRVFDFQRRARVYVLHGDLKQSLQLDPVAYRAGIAG